MPGYMPPLDLSRQVAEILRRIQRLERATAAPTGGGGFDPNADPVRIGNGAVATGTHTVTIGASSSATAAKAAAYGYSATADGLESIAAGPNSYAHGARSAALGYAAEAFYDDSVAIGSSVITDRAGQVMLSPAGIVDIYGNGGRLGVRSPDGTRWELTVENDGTLTTTAVP